jgi:signal transduction histidine kinase
MNEPEDVLLEELHQLRLRVLELEHAEQERQRLRTNLDERTQLATLVGKVSVALIQPGSLSHQLQQCVQALVTYLKAAFAGVWLLDEQTQMLELVASSGLDADQDGPHNSIPVGQLRTGRIASEGLAHATNVVNKDPEFNNLGWIKRENIVAFAGHPLIADGKTRGVVALFSRQPLSSIAVGVLATVSHALSLALEQKQMEEESNRLAQAMEAALQVRNSFLSSVSHDLKTPIAVMKGNVQIMQRRFTHTAAIDPQWAADRLALMEASVVKMQGMVEDLLTAAKLQAGQKLDLSLQPLLLLPLLETARQKLQRTSTRHLLRLTTTAHDFQVRGDPVYLDRVLTNVLANAVKYSPQGGFVSIDVRYEQEDLQPWIALRIQDTGIGIPEADLPFIFTPFYRASNVRGQFQGAGIGLASAIQILAQHNAAISVSSEEGRGSCFLLRFPLLA